MSAALDDFLNRRLAPSNGEPATTDGAPKPSEFLPNETARRFGMPPSLVKERAPLFRNLEERRQRRETLSGRLAGQRHLDAPPDVDPKEIGQLRNVAERLGGFTDAMDAFVAGQLRQPFMDDPRPLDERMLGAARESGVSTVRDPSTGEDLTVVTGSPLPMISAAGEAAKAGMQMLVDLLLPDAQQDETRTALIQRELDAVVRFGQRPTTAQAQEWNRTLAERLEANEDTALGQATAFGEAALSTPGGLTQVVWDNLIQQSPLLLAATAATAVTRNPNVFAGIVGAGSFATERGLAAAEFFAEKGIDIHDPEQLAAVLDDRDLMLEADDFGHTRALIIGAIDTLAARVASVAIGPTRTANAIRQTGVQAVSGGAGEALAQTATTGGFNMADALLEAFAEMGMAGPEVAGAAMAGRRERRAQATRARLDEMSQEARKSTLRRTAPETFRDLVEESDGGANLFVDAATLNTFFQERRIDPAAALQTAQGVTTEQFTAALEAGGDLVIPASVFATDLAGTPTGDFLVENARLDPNDMTVNEVSVETDPVVIEQMREFNQRARAEIRELETTNDILREQIEAQLIEAGRTTDAARAEASLFTSAYVTLAARGDMSVAELHERFGLPRIETTVDTILPDDADLDQDAPAPDQPAPVSEADAADQIAGEVSEAVERAVDTDMLRRTFDQDRRGSISMPGDLSDGETVIRLFENADLSTFIHESGHYFFTLFETLATADGAPQQLASDYQSVIDWFRSNAATIAREAGVSVAAVNAHLDGTTRSEAVAVALQEQWARGFEAFIMEGNAPSEGLRAAFSRMRAWLIAVYRQIRTLNVDLSDDVRAVMARMLATDVEIEQARQDSGTALLFSDAEIAQLSDADFQAYRRRAQAVTDKAMTERLTRALEPFRKARREKAKEHRKVITERVTAEIDQEPVYRAYDWLAFGRTDLIAENVRLDKTELTDIYGDEILAEIDRKAIGGKRNVYSAGNDARPIDEIAELAGFDSGDALIRALRDFTPKAEAIEAEVDARMREFHAQQEPDDDIEQQAEARLHNAEQERLIEFEAQQLAKLAGMESRAVMNRRSARKLAGEMIARMNVREAMNPQRFLTAERRASDAARKALARVVRRTDSARLVDQAGSQGAYHEAIRHKQQQLLNAALYAESVKVSNDVTHAEKLVRRLRTKKGRKPLAPEYHDALDEILIRYDFKRTSAIGDARTGALRTLVSQLTEENRLNELAVPDSVIEEARRRPYKTLRVEELRGVVDSLRNIEHIARNRKKLVDAHREAELDATVDRIVEQIASLPDEERNLTPTERQKRRRSVRGLANTAIFTPETIMRRLDGYTDLGPVHDAIGSSVFKGSNLKVQWLLETNQQVTDIFKVYSAEEKTDMARRVYVPELGRSASKWELLSVALNTGNEGNYARLTNPRASVSFTAEQVQAVLDNHLDARDMQVVQQVWDLLGSFWPLIEAREKRATGVVPERVASREVRTRHGTFKGGYFPIRYDPRVDNTNSQSIPEDETDLNKAMVVSTFTKAQTRRGHLEDRKKTVNRSLYLDAGAISTHLNAVIHDLALGEAVRNADRILEHGRVKDAFAAKGLQADRDALKLWLLDVAAGDITANGPLDQLLRHLRGGFTISRIGLNLMTVALQVTGVFQSAVQIGYGTMARGYLDYLKRPPATRDSIAREIMAKSAFMAERQKTFHKDALDFTDHMRIDVGANSSGFGASARLRMREVKNLYIQPLSIFLMQKVQFYVVDIPTWVGSYHKELGRSGDETRAIEFADRMVAQTQASGIQSDRTAMERGRIGKSTGTNNELVRMLTTLMSYMTRKLNVAYDLVGRTQGETLPRRVVEITFGWMMLYLPELILIGLIRGGLPDEDDEETLAGYLAYETAMSISGGVPGVGLVGSSYRGYGGGGAIGSIAETYGRALKQVSQGEYDRALRKATIDAVGTTFGLPAVQANRMWDWFEKDDAPLPELFIGAPPAN